MKNKVELLAPAGDWEAFLAAVENGADAVYLGGKLFNARQYAGNFDEDKIREALDYAHVRGVKVYLALNTLLLDQELQAAVDFVRTLYQLGVDGIIVQDLGLAGLIRALFPDLPLHASTQMTIYNPAGIRVLERLGFQRAVLARELSLEEIAAIAKNTSLEIEVFIHGALCVSYSGQCLMSSMIGGRSGNRGKCAQPCRLPYELVSMGGRKMGEKGLGKYLLSPKDLCSINEQSDLAAAGITSLKIEGRMKSPEYVAKVVQTYRKQLDQGDVTPLEMKDLMQMFNRGGPSSGYLHGKTGRGMMSWDKPKNWGIYLGEVISYFPNTKLVKLRLEEDLQMGDGVEIWNGGEESPGNIVSMIRLGGQNQRQAKKGTVVEIGDFTGRIFQGNKVYKTSDKRLNQEARESFSGKFRRKALLDCRVTLREGAPVHIRVEDDAGNISEANGSLLPEKALNRPLTEERIQEQLRKTGGTAFEFREISVALDQGLVIPVSELNEVRRKALEDMEQQRIQSGRRILSQKSIETKEILKYFPGNSRTNKNKVKIAAMFYQMSEVPDYSKLPADRLYVPFAALLQQSFVEKLKKFKENGGEWFGWIPSVTRGNYDAFVQRHLQQAVETGIDGLMIGNPGSIPWLEDFPQIRKMSDASMNVMNSWSVKELTALGFQGVTLSPELNLEQIGGIRGDVPAEVIVYGRIPVMTSEYCPVGCAAGGFDEKSKCSGLCGKENYYLKDRMGMAFPVFCDRIDCRSTIFHSHVLYLLDSMEKIKRTGVDGVRLNFIDESPAEIIALLEAHREVLDRGGQVLGKYEGLGARMKEKGYTKGHYFKGV